MEKWNNRTQTVGVVPLSALDAGGLDEIKRAVRDLGRKGVQVLTNIRGKPIDEFKAFWREAARLGAVVYVHPINAADEHARPYESDYDLAHVFGWPFETTLALSRLVFSGITSEFPNLKMISHHMGGMMPFFAGRMNEAYTQKTVCESLSGRGRRQTGHQPTV
jgi:aminocarboxymuconate-semialdehyde decarboxylase